ncbi:hypothetical protein PROFUN_02220 [Planoprotostelium fungivorum]|uniref:Uncharacterized protein n=1 Tax=Planoprotostelium fungivorum TaxID=1890364 RepID=A0A2P6NZF9_9EUKA|nr:hypothetical protein PROFUN_02220 [Planoprotostelium fungivorum]
MKSIGTFQAPQVPRHNCADKQEGDQSLRQLIQDKPSNYNGQQQVVDNNWQTMSGREGTANNMQ